MGSDLGESDAVLIVNQSFETVSKNILLGAGSGG